jgi:hypothetical protein
VDKWGTSFGFNDVDTHALWKCGTCVDPDVVAAKCEEARETIKKGRSALR